MSESLNASFLQNQLIIARKEINNLRQQLLSLNHVHRKECDIISKTLEEWQCSSCRKRQSNKEQTTSSSFNENRYDFQSRYIGMITTSFPEKRGTPRQPGICSDMFAKLTLDSNVFTNPCHALEGLQEFSHMWILFHFHRNDSNFIKAKVSPPRLNGIRTGVFASRSPHRPCPIGLSLVKIDRVVENAIYFSGVDMVNQTPVLDIKPYIPQYDSPGLTNSRYLEGGGYLTCAMSELATTSRDTSLNISDASTSNAQIGETMEISDVRVMDGQENGHRDQVLGASVTENTQSRTEEIFHVRSNSRMGEREAPDGEEEESPRITQASTELPGLPAVSTPEGHIRVPVWIDQPLVPRLTVLFKDRALTQLNQLGSEGEEKKIAITNVLREDPRSVYLRERWGSHCYVFRIAELYVSCKFNDNSQSVTVYQVFQNEVSPEGED